MATRGLGTLTLDLIAKIGGFIGPMNDAERRARRNFKEMRDDASSTSRAINSSLRTIAQGFVGAFSVREIYRATEQWTTINNRLTLVTDSSRELFAAQNDLFNIAQRTRQPLGATAELYQRIATNAKSLNLEASDLNTVIATINKTLAVSNTTGSAASAALVQLGQAFASNELRGQELNSVLEQAPALAKAIADGLGVAVGDLKALATAGELTARGVVDALINQADAVDLQFKKINASIGQSLPVLGNSLIKIIGSLDSVTGVSRTASEQILGLSEFLDKNLDSAMAAVIGSAELLAVVVGSKLTASVLSSGSAFVAAQIQSARYQATLARMAGVSGLAASAQVGMATAVRTANGAMALMGGPLGVATLAAGAIYYLSTRTTELDLQLDRLKGTTSEAVEEFKKLGEQQQRNVKFALAEEVREADKEVMALTARVATYRDLLVAIKRAGGTGDEFSLGGSANSRERELSALLESAQENALKLKTTLGIINDPTGFDRVNESTQALGNLLGKAAGEAEKLDEKVTETISKDFWDLIDAYEEVEINARKLIATYSDVTAEQEKLNESLKVADELRSQGLIKLAAELESVAQKSFKDFVSAKEKEKLEDLISGFAALEDRLDPAESAMRKYKEGQNELSKALDAGIVSLGRYYELFAKLDAELVEGKIGKSLDDLIDNSALFGFAAAKDAATVENAYTKAAERIDASFSSMWQNLGGDFDDLRDGIVGGFKTMLAEMAHEAITKPILLNIQQSFSGTGEATGDSGGVGSAAGAIGAGGFYAAIALAVVAGVGVWNKDQDEKFAKMTAEYRQGTQSLGTILGDANKKSESIANLTDILSKTASDTLSVNYEMYKTLVDIRTGITGVASGFAKTLTGSGNLDINEYTKAMWSPATTRDLVDGLGLDIEGGEGITNFVLDFTRGLTDSVAKELFKKKQRITDTGIEFAGQTLADILATGAIDAFAYADVETKKKVLGITTSTNSKRFTESLDSILLDQLGGVFAGASGALDQAASVFGLEFEDYVSRLTLSAQSLSLKDLEGEALTAEIEGFFSSTLDNWAGVLVDGSMVLEKFQQIGEGAFETVMRLASETATFSEYADDLNLSFSAVGFQAVNATQHIAELAGGFDLLGNSLASYADKFFSDSEKFLNMQAAIGEAYAELGVALPKSRDQFRDLVEGLDLATIAGREQFAALMRLTNATNTYLDALEKEQQVKEEALRSAVGGAFDAFNRALDAQRSELERASGQTIAALQGDIELAALALSSTQSVADSLGSTLKNLRLQSSQAELMNRRAAQAQLITANAISAAGGPLPGVGQLDDALRVLAEPSENLYSTFDEYARDFYTTARNIKALQEASGSQVGIDEQNLKTLQDQLQQAQDFHDSQMQQFDSLLKYYKDEISVLDGIDVSVLSVADAVDRLTQALLGAGSSTVVRQPVVPTLSNEYEKQKTARTMAVANNSTGTSVKRSGLVGGDQDEQSELLKLVKQLVEGLEVSQLAIAKNTNKSSKVLERWDIDGLPAERE